ncbi:MAG TPA: DUF1398 family protein [Chitinophagales bacterium]|nr:DUF1398 family protein [Chitinophagales bacterium]
MFTIAQIKDAHSQVKSGADFPGYIRAIKQLGVTGYQTFVTDGHTDYTGGDNYQISSDAKYSALEIAPVSDKAEFETYLRAHQQGQSDYLTFCQQSADTGVEKWVVDLAAMTCTYYDLAGNVMLEEKIPG